MMDYFDHLINDMVFYGKLKDFDLSNINQGSFEYLIINKVLVFDRKDNGANSRQLNTSIIYENVRYKINPSIYQEIYIGLKTIIEIEEIRFAEDQIDEIEFSLERFFNRKDKIEFLQRKFAEVIPGSINYAIFIKDSNLVSKGNYSNKGKFHEKYSSWEEIIKQEIGIKEIERFLIEDYHNLDEDQNDFLNDLCLRDFVNYNYSLSKLIHDWEKYYVAKVTGDFIISKIEILNKQNAPKSRTEVDGKTLKHFVDEKIYNSLIYHLEIDGLIDKNFNLIRPKEDKTGWKYKRAASCIGWLLKRCNFLNLNQKELVIVLSNTFNLELSEGTYSAGKIHFEGTNYDDDPHLVSYSFIDTLQYK